MKTVALAVLLLGASLSMALSERTEVESTEDEFTEVERTEDEFTEVEHTEDEGLQLNEPKTTDKEDVAKVSSDSKICLNIIGGQFGSGSGSGSGGSGSIGGGVTYVRWGRTSCPKTGGTGLVYHGSVAGSFYTHRGGASDLLCLPPDPKFLSLKAGGARALLYQTEYETSTGPSFRHLHDQDVPCAICLTTDRSIKLMIPGKITCPKQWTREYYGYLMADYYGHHRTTFTCVDLHAQGIPGTAANYNGALLYHVEVRKGSLPRQYADGNEMTCVVCTI